MNEKPVDSRAAFASPRARARWWDLPCQSASMLAVVGFCAGGLIAAWFLGSDQVILPRQASGLAVFLYLTSLCAGAFAVAGSVLGLAAALAVRISGRSLSGFAASLALSLFLLLLVTCGLLLNVYLLPGFKDPKSMAGNAGFIALGLAVCFVAYAVGRRLMPRFNPARVSALIAPVALLYCLAGTVVCLVQRDRRDPPAAEAPGDGQRAAANVLFISIDALRADHVGCYGYGKPTTANIDRLAETGVRFDNCIAQAPYTHPSMASMLSSRSLNSFSNYGLKDFVGPRITTLASVLQRAGMTTAAVITNPCLSRDVGFAQGFDHFDDTSAMIGTADRVTDLALEWLGGEDRKPFFLWLHYLDPHNDYVPPEPFAAAFNPTGKQGPPAYGQYLKDISHGRVKIDSEELERIVSLYDGEIAFTDREIGRLLDALDSMGILDSTLVIVTSDHGEEFLDHSHMLHGHSLYTELVRIPLILRFPDRLAAGKAVDTMVQGTDIAPTILDVLRLPVPGSFEGRSLLLGIDAPRALQREWIISEKLDFHNLRLPPKISLRTEDRTFILPVFKPYLFGYDPSKIFTLWKESLMFAVSDRTMESLDTGADPSERTPCDPGQAKRVAAAIRQYYENWPGHLVAHTQGAADPAVLDRMRSLGYLQ